MHRRSCLILTAALLGLLVLLAYFLWGRDAAPPAEIEAPPPAGTEDAGGEEAPHRGDAAYAEIAQRAPQITAEDGADFQVYIAFQGWNKPFVLNSRPRSSASIIKLYILGAAYELAERGDLNLDRQVKVSRADMVGGAGSISGQVGEPVYSVYALLTHMITESDNTATNVLLDIIGMDVVQDFIVRHGFSDTVVQRKMMDFTALREGRDNLTSARDVGRFFSLLRAGRLVSPAADRAMAGILLDQTDRECLNAAIPNARIAHKTGELAGVYHDAGIVYHGADSYVLCIMTNDSPGRRHTLAVMRRIAAMADEQFRRYRDKGGD